MHIYLAGPMTGRPHYNVEQFEFYESRLEGDGHTVVTPFAPNSVVWSRHFGRPFDPRSDECDYGHPLLPEMLAEDFKVLLSADGVYFLPGWRQSRGSRHEFAMARALGKPCHEAHDGAAITDDAVVSVQPTGPITAEAQSLVYGDRNAAYGHPHDDYRTTARLWEAYLDLPEGRIGAKHAAMMMALVKVSRESRRPKRDNLVDLAGYAECAWRIDQRIAGRE